MEELYFILGELKKYNYDNDPINHLSKINCNTSLKLYIYKNYVDEGIYNFTNEYQINYIINLIQDKINKIKIVNTNIIKIKDSVTNIWNLFTNTNEEDINSNIPLD